MMIRTMRMLRVLTSVLAMGLWAGSARADASTREQWYIVQLQGQKAGHMQALQTTRDGKLTTKAEMKLEIKRDRITVPIKLSTEFVETLEHKPVSMSSTMALASMPTTTSYVFTNDGVEVSINGGEKQKQETPKDEWLTPGALEKLITRKIEAGEKEFSARSLDPSTGLAPSTTTMKLLEKTTLDVVGKTVPALKWSTATTAVKDVETIQYTDETGLPLRSETSIGGLKFVLILADKQLALSKSSPPELLNSLMIMPERPIANPQETSKGVFVVTSSGKPIGDWPSAASQTVERINDRSVRVRVDVRQSSEATKEQIESKEFTDPSAMITSADVKVKALTRQALTGQKGKPAAERAETLRKFVHQYISKKSLDVGFATAAETAKTKQGDCTEHGVLLAALLRADGIPSRVVSGLVYVDGIKDGQGAFGYHMWTQAMLEIDGKMRWVDLDATLSATRAFDGTHIAMQTPSMADGQTINALVDIAPTMGQLSIKVESIE